MSSDSDAVVQPSPLKKVKHSMPKEDEEDSAVSEEQHHSPTPGGSKGKRPLQSTSEGRKGIETGKDSSVHQGSSPLRPIDIESSPELLDPAANALLQGPSYDNADYQQT